MLTASHTPPADNGIKLFADGVEFDRERERRVEERVADETSPAGWEEWRTTETVAPLPAYRDAVVSYAVGHGASPAGMTVAVDCGNGMASLATPQVLRELGARVVALNANVDGHFTARESKPTAESLADLRSFVADGGAALGIGHDGDADRIVIVDGDGEVVHEDTVLALVAEHYTRDSGAGDPVVVTTPNASGRIDELVAEAGGRVERVRLGALHEGVAAARSGAAAETEVVFAAEPWKHIHPAFGGWIDGVTSAAVFTRLVADQGLSSLRDRVTERPYRKKRHSPRRSRKRRSTWSTASAWSSTAASGRWSARAGRSRTSGCTPRARPSTNSSGSSSSGSRLRSKRRSPVSAAPVRFLRQRRWARSA